MLDNIAQVHNIFKEDLEAFLVNDPHLSKLKHLIFVHPMDWWNGIDWSSPGIYILTGGRQIGKSTSLKLLIKNLLTEKKWDKKQIYYLPCDTISDYNELLKIVREVLGEIDRSKPYLIMLDEVTFVSGWDRTIKALADEGVFEKGFCILTGSDSVILKDAAQSFPGRRGNSDKVDFHLHPLSFREYIKLVHPSLLQNSKDQVTVLFEEFENYFKCGGFLRAINDLHMTGNIFDATYATFEQWIAGDFTKRNKNIKSLQEVLKALFVTSTSQVTYSGLTERCLDLSKDTFIEYSNMLERMDVLLVSEAFDQNSRLGFPKKARKFYFADPFIIDVISRWLIRERYIQTGISDEIKPESIAASHCRREFPTYYMKAEGEIDIVIVDENKFTPIEIKWTNQIRPRDLKQLKKYSNSVILTKQRSESMFEEIKSMPLPLYLLEFMS